MASTLYAALGEGNFRHKLLLNTKQISYKLMAAAMSYTHLVCCLVFQTREQEDTVTGGERTVTSLKTCDKLSPSSRAREAAEAGFVEKHHYHRRGKEATLPALQDQGGSEEVGGRGSRKEGAGSSPRQARRWKDSRQSFFKPQDAPGIWEKRFLEITL